LECVHKLTNDTRNERCTKRTIHEMNEPITRTKRKWTNEKRKRYKISVNLNDPGSITTTFCHEFVRNISAKIGCNTFCYYLMVLNWHCIHWDTIENKKKTYINFIPCSARTISSFCQIIIFFGAISIHCGGRHPVSVMVNTLFLKYTSCCCSTSSEICLLQSPT
jgi:hypothetical protein